MKEARIIMPVAPTLMSANTHMWLQRSLVKEFGGVTMSSGEGIWVDDGRVINDTVRIYDVAIEPNPDQDNKLMALALEAGRALNQKAVYIRFSNGQVRILDVNFDQQPDEPAVDVKRKPSIHEVWRCRDGSTAAVVRILKDGFECVALTVGVTAIAPGGLFFVDSTGALLTLELSRHPLDLAKFVSSYDATP